MDSPGEDARSGWREIRTVDEVGSTNAAVAALAADGEPEGLVLVADRQTAGRGRLDRTWTAPPGTGLTFSVLLRPQVPTARLGWLPLLGGLAVTEHLGTTPGLRVSVKWPNDVMAGDRKLGGVLAERVASRSDDLPAAVVLGIGLNVTTPADELPVPTATSIAVELGGEAPDRGAILHGVLDVLAARYASWTAANGDADACGLRPAYTVRCATIGRRVRVTLPAGDIEGEAVGIDPDGALRVADPTSPLGTHTVHAGDVVHVR